MLRSGWRQGPAADSLGDSAANGIDSDVRGAQTGAQTAPLIVSVTDFTSHAYRDLPGIARRGFMLRRRWPQLDGAVGMWLWVAPTARRCGAVSVWTGRRALAAFVRLPEHVVIMDEYRERGTIRSMILEYESFDAARIRQDAEAWLMSDDRFRAARGAARHGD
ncbi:hypothetical protein [Streptomyces lasiicapitis]|uniref:DUF3291 domain-containing protein n=1 Tax=Streptomyces lasiicapitis TaxID=1923961 RepID=A0ABQ2M215_9ACTN|nr:hypothetical protein [Streptomyces lasiicapitis]GGO45812.1 hypothetical protein GCM10012286_35210 [Streptomyces lasiicapitis]